jgi:hypothetical protein
MKHHSLHLHLRPVLFSFLALSFLVPASPLFAGKVQAGAIKNQGIFGIALSGTAQEFYGRADQVLSVSFQEYTTGPLFVSEVVIDMTGSNQLFRIYHARPVSLSDAAAAGAAAASAASELSGGAVSPTVPDVPSDVTTAEATVHKAAARVTAGLVVKTYPHTTHAKTAEFSVSSREELVSFFRTFRDLYVNREVKVKNNTVVPAATLATGGGVGALTINRIGGVLFTIQ